MRAALLSQGDEVLQGHIVDTNSAWLADALIALGIEVIEHRTVGDDLELLTRAFQVLTESYDVILSTGGLGPTCDDLTSEAMAAAAGVALAFDAEAHEHIVERYARAGRAMAAANRKQAYLPVGATRLDNAHGTAPGFLLTVPRPTGSPSLLVALPGPPNEMRPMFERQVTPALVQRSGRTPDHRMVLRTTGIGESALQDRIGTLDAPGVRLGFHTTPGENRVKLAAHPDVPLSDLHAVATRVHHQLGDVVFSVEGPDDAPRSLAAVIGDRLVHTESTFAVAESCTGGRIASLLTSVPGASRWFLGGMVAYANQLKQQVLGVPDALLHQFGAVSEPVAAAMAEGMRALTSSDITLATTGIAGPGGGTPSKPVGLVCFAVCTAAGTVTSARRFQGNRHRVQVLASAHALDLVRRTLSPSPSH